VKAIAGRFTTAGLGVLEDLIQKLKEAKKIKRPDAMSGPC